MITYLNTNFDACSLEEVLSGFFNMTRLFSIPTQEHSRQQNTFEDSLPAFLETLLEIGRALAGLCCGAG